MFVSNQSVEHCYVFLSHLAIYFYNCKCYNDETLHWYCVCFSFGDAKLDLYVVLNSQCSHKSVMTLILWNVLWWRFRQAFPENILLQSGHITFFCKWTESLCFFRALCDVYTLSQSSHSNFTAFLSCFLFTCCIKLISTFASKSQILQLKITFSLLCLCSMCLFKLLLVWVF